jgi:tetratricopeptide (TPR) repeat protein
MALNPHDPYSRLRYGMCLHWLGRHEEAGQYFEEGLQLDPQGYYANALMGWHFLQLGDWDESGRWFEKSLELLPAPHNAIAPAYLAILQQVRNRPEFAPGR